MQQCAVGHPTSRPRTPCAPLDARGVRTCQLRLLILDGLAVVLGHVQALVDVARDGLDLCPQLFLDTLQVEAIIVCDQIDG